MKCQEAETSILLADAGGIADNERVRLEEHLAGCEGCRCFQRDLARLALTVAERSSRRAPRPGTTARIHMAAEAALQQRSRPWLLRWPVFGPAVAAAAALALIVGGWLMTGNSQEARIGEMSAILTVVSGQAAPTAQPAAASSSDAALRALARHLLITEGLNEEASAEQELPAAATPDTEPGPTALQPRSTGAPPARRYV